jgi:hypothetical protein
MIYYKIRKKSDPTQFRKSDGTWNGTGKVYDTLGKMRAVITQHMNSQNEWYRRQLDDWEYVEYEVREREVQQLIDVVDKKKVWEILKR